MNRQLIKEDIQIANKDMKQGSILLTRKMQDKISMKHHYIWNKKTQKGKKKRWKTSHVDKDMKQLKLSYIVERTEN